MDISSAFQTKRDENLTPTPGVTETRIFNAIESDMNNLATPVRGNRRRNRGKKTKTSGGFFDEFLK